jgi:hypothetical protein
MPWYVVLISLTRLEAYRFLGFLFRAHPTLMTMEQSAVIMDEIFASPEEDGKGRLLKIIQDFLVSEASKHSAKEKGMFVVRCQIVGPDFLQNPRRRRRNLQMSIWKN